MSKKIGLALGSGAYKGLAHIGILQVLKDHEVPIHYIAGSSMGALVGGAYCAGHDPYALADLVYSLNEREYYDPVLSRTGFMRGDKAHQLIRTLTNDMNLEDMAIPLSVVACDLNTGCEAVFRTGSAHEAIRGSISVPGIFVPHVYGEHRLIDGGVLNRVPVYTVRDMGADIIIAVDVGYRGDPPEITRTADILMFAVDAAIWQHTSLVMSVADIAVVPDMQGVSGNTLRTAKLAVERGRAAMSAQIDALLALLGDR